MRKAIILIMTFCVISTFGQTKDSIVQGLEYDGGIYTGEVQNGKPHGIGRMVYASDDPARFVYEGSWENGKRHGHGIMILKNHDVYKGDWKDDVEHGEGTCDYSNGDKYVGNWENGLWNGRGHYIHDGHDYIGFWKSTVVLEIGRVLIECTDDKGHPFL